MTACTFADTSEMTTPILIVSSSRGSRKMVCCLRHGRPAHACAAVVLRSDRLPPTPHRSPTLEAVRQHRRRRSRGRARRRTAGQPAFRRALRPAVARCGSLQRQQRLRLGRVSPAGLAVSRLRRPLVQRGQAVRPVHSRATGRRRVARRAADDAGRAGLPDRDRLLAARPARQRGRVVQ